jgi:cell wall-associated NlpC family hydrolase
MHRRVLRRRVPFTLAAALVAASWTETAVALTDTLPVTAVKAERREPDRGPGRRALAAARAQIGSGYAMGATGPGAFDCSGLTMHAFGRAGVALPHSSFAQYEMGRAIGRDDIRAGDLVFFDTAGPGASHVGVATGKGTAVSATSSGVMEHSMSDAYWGGAYVGARRIAD